MRNLFASVNLVYDYEGRMFGLTVAQEENGQVIGLHLFDLSDLAEFATGGALLIEGAKDLIRFRVKDALRVDDVFIIGMSCVPQLAGSPEMLQFSGRH